MNERADHHQLSECTGVTCDDFFSVFDLIDKQVLSKNFSRVSALLQNLKDRRSDGWKKHLVTETGPMTLDEVRKDLEAGEDAPEEKKPEKKKNAFDFENALKEFFKIFDKGAAETENAAQNIESGVKELRKMIAKDPEEAYSYFLKLVADAKKDMVLSRVSLFEAVIATPQFKEEDFFHAYSSETIKVKPAVILEIIPEQRRPTIPAICCCQNHCRSHIDP